jgi:RES domain-containing protein
VLTALQILDPALVHVVGRAEVPNPNWLVPGIPSAGQQVFGDQLLTDHLFVAIRSTVSKHSWNLVYDAQRAAGAYKLAMQEAFALDTRLHPPTT